jgi:hypothetical protein
MIAHADQVRRLTAAIGALAPAARHPTTPASISLVFLSREPRPVAPLTAKWEQVGTVVILAQDL